jgi:hypothetical protein
MLQEETINNSTLLFQKNELCAFKYTNNEYGLTFPLRNPDIYLDKIITMNFLNVIYALNKDDIIEEFHLSIDPTNEDKGTVYILFRHFFEDFGFQQKYLFLDIVIERTTTHIIYKGTTNVTQEGGNNSNAELLHLSEIYVACDIQDVHNVMVESKIKIQTKFEIPTMIEKMASILLHKIFMKLKQLIENYKY